MDLAINPFLIIAAVIAIEFGCPESQRLSSQLSNQGGNDISSPGPKPA